MIRACKQFRKKLSFIKHEKLCEDSGQDPVVEGVTFYVRYLGSCFVINQTGDETTGEAIKSIVSMARKTDRKLNRVALMVSIKDVKMTDLETGAVYFDISIYRISSCTADAVFSHVFAFIAVNTDQSMQCHAFLCRKRKIAQAATMTIAQAFNLAFQSWRESQEKDKEETMLMNGNCISEKDKSAENELLRKCVNEKTNDMKNAHGNKAYDETSIDEEDLLIDLNSPGDTLDNKTASTVLVNIGNNDTQDMDENFSKLPETPNNIPLLKHLPSNASSLSVCAFVGSQSLLDSSADSPLHGSSLTPTKLCTPASSPAQQVRHRLEKTKITTPSPLASPSIVK